MFDGCTVLRTESPTHCGYGHELRSGRLIVGWNPGLCMQQMTCLACEEAGWMPATWCLRTRWITAAGDPITSTVSRLGVL